MSIRCLRGGKWSPAELIRPTASRTLIGNPVRRTTDNVAMCGRVEHMLDETEDTELDTVIALERKLQTKACRNNRARVLELLAPDFTEVGASGRVWNLSSILDLLASQTDDRDEIEVRQLSGRKLAENFVLVLWTSAYKGRCARRTSLWRRDEVGWRQVHHQGTPLHADTQG